jgi:L-ribulose-5-phosphate 3-epimerase
MSNLIVNTYAFTLTHSSEDTVRHLLGHGFNRFELMMYPGHMWPADLSRHERSRLRRLFADEGAHIRSLNQPNIDLNIGGATREMREYSLGILSAVIELAGDLGVPDFIIGPGKMNPLMPAPRERILGYFHEALHRLVPLARSAGVRLLLENMPFGFVPDAPGLMELIEDYDPMAVGIIYDVANGYFIKEDLREALELTIPRLKMIHFSDTGLDVYRHSPVGTGTVDFTAVAEDLRTVGWEDPLVIEIVGISDDPTAELLASIERLRALGWQADIL